MADYIQGVATNLPYLVERRTARPNNLTESGRVTLTVTEPTHSGPGVGDQHTIHVTSHVRDQMIAAGITNHAELIVPAHAPPHQPINDPNKISYVGYPPGGGSDPYTLSEVSQLRDRMVRDFGRHADPLPRLTNHVTATPSPGTLQHVQRLVQATTPDRAGTATSRGHAAGNPSRSQPAPQPRVER